MELPVKQTHLTRSVFVMHLRQKHFIFLYIHWRSFSLAKCLLISFCSGHEKSFIYGLTIWIKTFFFRKKYRKIVSKEILSGKEFDKKVLRC